MRYAHILIMASLCLNFTLLQTDVLNQHVSLHYQETAIAQILDSIHRQYGVNFSYLNNELPDSIKCSIHIDDQPLHIALDKILEDTDLGYQVVSGQIVLKKAARKATKPALEEKQDHHPAKTTTGDSRGEKSVTLPAKPEPQQDKTQKETQKTAGTIHMDQPVAVPTKERTPVEQVQKPARTTVEEPPYASATTPRKNFAGLSEVINRGLDKVFQQRPEASDYETRTFHIGLIYPLSTNGTAAGRYVNKISLHALVGYAAGLDGFEASGFGNIQNDYVDGVQFAGFFNLVKNEVHGVQGAGFININGSRLNGAQMAGFINLSGGSINGAQLAGFMNMASGGLDGIQGAGFLNIATGDSDGAQLAGFANIVSGDVEGFQGSGFINIARKVKGTQLGVFNVADSIDGIPIGFLSIVRKNGYRTLEVWGSEALQANVGFKIGVERFYNIFAVGTQFTDADFHWGLGYGIGTQWPSAPTWHFNLDLLSFNIFEEGNTIFKNQDLNLLNMLRLGINKQFSEHFSLFIAPTFNVMVSQLQNTENNIIGSDIAPWTVYNKTFEGKAIPIGSGLQSAQTNVKIWPGLQIGLRF